MRKLIWMTQTVTALPSEFLLLHLNLHMFFLSSASSEKLFAIKLSSLVVEGFSVRPFKCLLCLCSESQPGHPPADYRAVRVWPFAYRHRHTFLTNTPKGSKWARAKIQKNQGKNDARQVLDRNERQKQQNCFNLHVRSVSSEECVFPFSCTSKCSRRTWISRTSCRRWSCSSAKTKWSWSDSDRFGRFAAVVCVCLCRNIMMRSGSWLGHKNEESVWMQTGA